jgi:predicted nucleic acid-binding protein
MPLYPIEGIELDLPRNLAILDSNILIALALPDDSLHAEVEQFIEEQDQFIFGVPPPVVAEACSFIIGKKKRHDLALNLLRWLLTPGSGVILLPAPHGPRESDIQAYLNADSAWMLKHHLDYVDAYLMHMAHMVTVSCQLKPGLIIITKDMKDYLRCWQQGYSFSVYDITQREVLDFS